MSYRVALTRTAEKQLRRIHPDQAGRIRQAIDDLAGEPRPPRHSRKLQGQDDLRRLRVGDYRVIYEVRDDQEQVLVLEVWHRQRDYR